LNLSIYDIGTFKGGPIFASKHKGKLKGGSTFASEHIGT